MSRTPVHEATPVSGPQASRLPGVYRLYGQAYDFAPCAAGPASEFMLASLPRAGSTWLAVELWRTGVMGAPMEYANQPLHNALQQRVGSGADLAAYWHAVKRLRTSPNGVFGYKLFASDYVDLYAHHPKLFAQLAPAKIVFLTRANVVAQAVSYSKAMRSAQWFPDARPSRHVAYDAAHIRWCVAMVRYQIAFWNRMFAKMDATPWRVNYEELLADPVVAIQGIADFLGVALDPNAVVDLPHTQVQRDGESTQWVQRYNRESNSIAGAQSS